MWEISELPDHDLCYRKYKIEALFFHTLLHCSAFKALSSWALSSINSSSEEKIPNTNISE